MYLANLTAGLHHLHPAPSLDPDLDIDLDFASAAV